MAPLRPPSQHRKSPPRAGFFTPGESVYIRYPWGILG